MGVGSKIRHRLGPLEPVAAESYRARFIDLDDFSRTVASLVAPTRIIEIGCGDGAVAERMCRLFAETYYVGVDVAPAPGRLFRGDRHRASFRRINSADLLAEDPEQADLVLLVDVFHHLPEPQRLATLQDVDALCAPGGTIVIKDWARTKTLAHLACFVSDRYITGDPNARYASRGELWEQIQAGIPDAQLVCEAQIPPRRNNLMFALRKPPA